MGYLTKLVNKLDSKKYVISTAKVRGGVWQTAVFRAGIFPFNLVLPIVRMHSTVEEKAYEVHSLIETVVNEYPRSEWKRTAKALEDDEGNTIAIMALNHAKVVLHPDESGQSQPPDASFKMDWYLFRGLSNTSAALRQKAIYLSKVISRSLDTGVEFAQMMPDPWHLENKQVGRAKIVKAQAETAAVLLHIVDNIAFKVVSANDRNEFMEALEECVSVKLQEIGMPSADFLGILRERYEEYAKHRLASKEAEGGLKKVFWEYSKRIAEIMGIRKNLIFNYQLDILLGKQILRWNLEELLKGD